ncbi:MAG TPA: hypothetical protein VFI12_07210 [Thermomicrobiales bacterium]|jgi:hypothetical protein|nr:hypothetical protein [Thermomicrobiales bacterium]
MEPTWLLAMVMSAVVSRRWAIPVVAVACAIFTGLRFYDSYGMPLLFGTIGALAGLPLRWGIEELIDETREVFAAIIPHRHDPR